MADATITTPTKMKLDELLSLVQKSKIVQMAEFERQMSLFKHKEIKALDYGKLDLKIQGLTTNHSGAVFTMKLNERVIQGSDFAIAGINNPDSRESYESKITFSLPLYTGGKISSYKKITKKLVAISNLSKKDMINQKSYEVKKGFYSIILLKNLITQITNIKTNTLFLRESVKQMRIEGYATKTDILLLDARIAEMDSLVHQLQTNKELIFHFISFLTSTKVTDISYDDSMIDIRFNDILDSDILTQNIDIQKANKAIEIKREQLSISRSGYLPQIGLMAEYGSNDEKLFKNFHDHDYYIVGVGASWNIFSGGATLNNTERSKVDLLKQQTTLSYAKEGLLLKADDIRTKIKNLNYKLNALAKEQEYKKEIFENFKESHKEQRASMNDVLLHQSHYIQTVMKIEENQNLKFTEIFKFQTLIEDK